MLAAALEVASDCFELLELDMANAEHRLIRKKLLPLATAQVEFPTDLKKRVLAWGVRELCDQPDMTASAEKVRKLLYMATPWCHGVDGETDFKPLEPALRAVEGSPMEKALMFSSVILEQVMTPMVVAGEDSKDTVLNFSSDCIDYFESLPKKIDDVYTSTMSELLTVWRALSTLLIATDFTNAAEVMALCSRYVEPTKSQGPVNTFAVVLRSVPYYQGLLDDFRATHEFTMANLATLERWIQQLQPDAPLVVPRLCADLLSFVKLRGSVRRATAPAVQEGFVAHIRKTMASFHTWRSSVDVRCVTDEVYVKAAGFLELMRCASKCVPSSDVDVSEALQQAAELHKQVLRTHQAQEFVSRFKYVTVEWLGTVDIQVMEDLGTRRCDGNHADTAPRSMDEVAAALVELIGMQSAGDTRRNHAFNIGTIIMETGLMEVSSQAKSIARPPSSNRA